MWPEPHHSSTEASTEIVKLRKIVIPKVQVMISLSRMNEIHGKLGSSKRSMTVLEKYYHR